MAAPLPLRRDFTSAELRREARRSRDANQARRLLALAAIYDGGSRGDAARIGGVGLQIGRDWVVQVHLERLGDRLSELGKHAPAAWACGRARNHHPLARQMRRQRTARRPTPGEPLHDCAICLPSGIGGNRVLRGRALQLLEFQLQLIEHFAATFGGGAKAVTLQLGDQQLQMRHHRLGARRACFRLATRQLFSREGGPECGDLVAGCVGGGRHAGDSIPPGAGCVPLQAGKLSEKFSRPSPVARFVAGGANRSLPTCSRAAPP